MDCDYRDMADGRTADASLRERMRQRRRTWARRGDSVAVNAMSGPEQAPGACAAPFGRTERGRRSWSLKIELLDRERILRGWTQRELARMAHVDPGTLSELLSRRRRPTFGTVQALCASLNLTLADVIVFEADNTSAAS